MSTLKSKENSPPVFDKSEAIKKAQSYLQINDDDQKSEVQRKAIVEENKVTIKDLAADFEDVSDFTYARRLYQLLYQYLGNSDLDTVRRLAVCTYKDSDLSSDVKYDAAANLLISCFQKDGKIEIPIVLGTLGSIYKKKWKYENHDGHLFQSLRYYLQGYKIAIQKRRGNFSNIGFCGINLAYIYDTIANLESYNIKHKEDGIFLYPEEDPFAEMTRRYAQEAKKYRVEVHENYLEKYKLYESQWKDDPSQKVFFDTYVRYWFFVTWGEALLGLGDFPAAAEKFKEAIKKIEGVSEVPSWKRHTASLQGFQLIELLYSYDAVLYQEAKDAIKVLLDIDNVPDYHTDKLGLAFSGGGFRASFFHIGVLAKLAEADLLRKVEVISCVSGGSILGAYYYLKLKNMLESSDYETLTKQDYINLVAELEVEFLDKVNKNVRMNILSHFWSNIKMAFASGYSRTTRTADLYDKFLYADLLEGKKIVYMDDLLISPGGDKSFRPNRDNWKVENKVPVLILNATTLNTGHSWQFTGTWMGESPAYIDSEFDALPNLRRMYYSEAPPEFRKIQLSTAVVASAGVPGMFAPVEFNNLYEDYTRVLLVDGGVHDNQGVSTLYEQECNMLIVSDASGQMPASKRPPNSEIGVVGRTNGILQERIRFSQFRNLEARKKSGVVHDYILMHFTKDLPSEVVNWKDSDDPYVPPVEVLQGKKRREGQTIYDVRHKIQRLVARIRTDLDAFHETEASALMYSGYKMTDYEINISSSEMFDNSKTEPKLDLHAEKWNFMKVHDLHEDDKLSDKLEKKLLPSSLLFGKVFHLLKGGLFIQRLLMLLFAGGLAWFMVKGIGINLSFLGIVAGVLVGTYCFDRLFANWIGLRSLVLSVFILFPILGVLWLVSVLIRHWSTWWYLREGRISKVRE